jgi:hypothetical protein
MNILYSIFSKPSTLVMNLNELYMRETHREYLCFCDPEYAEYFDSTGLLQLYFDIMRFL